uniref:F-box domain-containing protein n=1 Tax=Physcomitrium patens TaxID=3218 RepID=A0A7I4BQA1_PHYPA
MVKSKEQRKARREERAWNTWLWGAKGNAVWDESGRTALRIDLALRQNARAAAADVSQVESEQFAWQAGRWGNQSSSPQGDDELLKAALASLGSCSLNEIRETVKSSTSESDSKSQSSGDEADIRASSKTGCAPGISGSWYGNFVCRNTVECNKCGCKSSSTDGIAQNHQQVSHCQCGPTAQTHRQEYQDDILDLTRGFTARRKWPTYSFGAERPIHCSCLWNLEKSCEFVDDARRKRFGNLSPIDRVSDDVIMRIFAKLSRREVIGISAVCRRWRDVASCEPLWKHVELVSVAESLGDRELGLLAEKRLKHTAVLSIALCWRISSKCLGSLMKSDCGKQLLCLDLSFCNLDDSVVNRVVENCSSLQRLRLFGGLHTVSGQALAGLANLSQLRELDLGLCVNVSQHTLKEIGSKLKLLVILSLAGCPRVTMANLLYLCGCVSLEALCLVGCKAVYPNQASVIAQELITGGCSRLAMVEAGNQLPNAAPFPARPPPPPPLLYPAHGVAFKESGSPTDSPTTSHMSRKFGKQADKCGDSNASDESDQQLTDRVQNKDQVRLGMRTETEMVPPVGRLEGDTQAAYAAATHQFQQGQMELSGGNMGAATHAFRAACHFNPSAAAYTFMAWMQRLAGADRSECVRECARAIFLDNDYGNPWNDVACELWDAGDISLAARFFQRAKACSRYEVGAGHLPYLNLAKLRLSESPNALDGDGLDSDKTVHDTPSKEALLELCAALIRAPGDEVVQQMVFHMLDSLKECDKSFTTVR